MRSATRSPEFGTRDETDLAKKVLRALALKMVGDSNLSFALLSWLALGLAPAEPKDTKAKAKVNKGT